jgi:serine protease Do
MRKHLFARVLGMIFALQFISSGVVARELPDFTQLVEKYGSAVVNISTSAKKDSSKNKNDDDDESEQPNKPGVPKMPGSPEDFNEFFRHFFDQEKSPYQGPATSLGSGFIISSDGYIVTNNHVIQNADEIIVRLTDRREFVAKLKGADKLSDIALLKVEATDLPTVKLGVSKNLKVGEWVLAIGSPFGFDHSVTAGIVSAKGRSLPSDNYVPFIQTDAAANPGNSGGPLFNMDGEVVGVISQIYSRSGGFMGISFAIPVDVMNNVVEQLKKDGKVARGWLGVLIQDVTRELAESFKMSKPHGALVAKVLPNSPAAQTGFKVGDIIVEFDGKEIEHSSDLPPMVGISKVGSSLPAKVIRDGKELTLSVVIAELPPEDELQAMNNKGGKGSTNSDKLGLTVRDLDDKQREAQSVQEGGVLVEKVDSKGAAFEAGIRKDDVIISMNHTRIENAKQFKEIVADLKDGQSVAILIHRNGSPRFLAMKVPAEK